METALLDVDLDDHDADLLDRGVALLTSVVPRTSDMLTGAQPDAVLGASRSTGLVVGLAFGLV